MQRTKITVRNDDDDIIGYIRNYGCENDECTTAVVNGRVWHAIPSTLGVTLLAYHFRDVEAGVRALHGVWES